MAKAGVWGFGWVVRGGGDAVCAVVVDEEHELLETRVIEGEDLRAGIAALIADVRAEIGRPRKIVVLEGAAAKALRAAGVREEIVVGRSPALEEALKIVEVSGDGRTSADYLDGEGVELAHLRAFFEAAERLWHAEPWCLFERATAFGVRAEALGVEEGGLFLMREGEEEEDSEESERTAGGGWMFVFSPEDVDRVAEVVAGDARDAANVLSLSYGEVKADGPSVEAMLSENDLPIAARDALPMLSRAVRGVGMVPPSAKDYELATALCAALVRVAEEEEPEDGWCEVELRTASGASVLVEGPIDDDDESFDDDDDDEVARSDDGWTPGSHPWIEEVDAFVASHADTMDELSRRQLHYFCRTRAEEDPASWGERALREHVALVAADLPLLQREAGGVIDALASWIDARAGLEGSDSMQALVSRERDALIASVMDRDVWSPQKMVVCRLREDGVDLSDPTATQDALRQLLATGELDDGEEPPARRGRGRRGHR